MITINNINKSFGKKIVLNDINFNIESNSIFGLIGINGAGKSTFLRILSDSFKPDSGFILYDGKLITELESKQEIFFLPDDPFSSSIETISSLLLFYKSLYEFNEDDFFNYVKTFKLDKAIGKNMMKKSISRFSKGMKRQLFICIALAISPKYLLLDEAFDGLDPLARITFRNIVKDKIKNSNMTVIISSHSLRELEDLCDAYALIDGGKVDTTQGMINNASYHKYQLAFSKETDEASLCSLNIINYSKTGSVIQIIVDGEEDVIYQELLSFNPLFVDKLPIDFEELFILDIEKKGYINHEN